MPRPHVIAHLAVSVDGLTTGFAVDVGRFYELAATWHEDVTLAGSETILAQAAALAAAPQPGPAAEAPLLAVVDGRGRVTQWEQLRRAGWWSDVLALSCAATPPRRTEVAELRVGQDRVDLPAALAALGRRERVRTVRVDSGGVLVGALLAAGLLDEVSLLVHPVLVGASGGHRWYGAAAPRPAGLTTLACRTLEEGLVWLRYAVTPEDPPAPARTGSDVRR